MPKRPSDRRNPGIDLPINIIVTIMVVMAAIVVGRIASALIFS